MTTCPPNSRATRVASSSAARPSGEGRKPTTTGPLTAHPPRRRGGGRRGRAPWPPRSAPARRTARAPRRSASGAHFCELVEVLLEDVAEGRRHRRGRRPDRRLGEDTAAAEGLLAQGQPDARLGLEV